MKSLIIPICLAIAALLLAAPPATNVHFTDVTTSAGIRFHHNAGKAGNKYLPETMGSGVAFFDALGDGWPDILLINSKDWTPRGRKSLPALYRNNHDGTFTDITAGSGLDVEMYGMGVAIADYDNDGRRTSTSRPSMATIYSTTKATENSATSHPDQAFTTPTSAPAPPGSITTAMARWTCSSPTTSSGLRRAT